MADSTESNATPNIPGTNPNTTSRDGAINPSDPTSGTEAWGNTSDERRVVSTGHQKATRAGQMKGNPGDKEREASQKTEDEGKHNKRRE